MNKLTRYEAVTQDWTDDSGARSNIELARFHYFNPNGLYHRKKKMDDTINHWVDAGHIPTGWIVATGGRVVAPTPPGSELPHVLTGPMLRELLAGRVRLRLIRSRSQACSCDRQ